MRRISRVVLVGSLCLASVPAGAITVAPADLPMLVEQSRAVVHGRVVDVRAEWVADRQDIETLVTIDVDRYLKGGSAPTLTFRVPGGEVGIYRSIVPGAPAFAAGEEVILFLGGRGAAVPHVLGLSQGVFRVVRPTAGDAQVLLTVPLSDPRRGSPDPPMPLEALVSRVRSLVAGGDLRQGQAPGPEGTLPPREERAPGAGQGGGR